MVGALAGGGLPVVSKWEPESPDVVADADFPWDESEKYTPRFPTQSVVLCSQPDDDLEFAATHREKAARALQEGNSDAFIGAAMGVLHEMGRLPSTHPYASFDFLMYIGPTSPVNAALRAMLDMSFRRSVLQHHGRSNGSALLGHDSSAKLRPNNFSGLCLAGARGNGKSHVMKCAALAATVLLPNFVAVVVDATSAGAGTTSGDVVTEAPPEHMAPPIIDVIRRQYAKLGLHSVANKRTLGGVLDAALHAGFATAVFVDEARHLYTRHVVGQDGKRYLDPSWMHVHTMLNRFETCVFFADSMTLLPALVRGDKERIEAAGVRMTQTELNATKMIVKAVPTMSTSEQYVTYCSSRQPFCGILEKCDDATKARWLRTWHMMTGGSMRALHALSENDFQFDMAKRTASPDSDVARALLTAIHARATKMAVPEADVFDLPHISEPEARRVVTKYNEDNGTATMEYAAIIDTVKDGVISMTSGNRGRHTTFSYASPQQWLALNAWKPTVFVSHAVVDVQGDDDNNDERESFLRPLCDALERNNIKSVVWQDCIEAMVGTQQGSTALKEWMEGQVLRVRDDATHSVLVVLSKAYCERLGSDTSGAYWEAAVARRLLEMGGDIAARVVIAAYDPTGPVSRSQVQDSIPEEFAILRNAFRGYVVDVGHTAEREQLAVFMLACPDAWRMPTSHPE